MCTPPSAFQEITAAALEALSLSDTLPTPTLPSPKPTATTLERLPANVPLPLADARTAHVHRLLRAVTQIFHTALHSSDLALLTVSVTSVHALAVAGPAYRTLLAHLGVVRLLAPSFALLARRQDPAALRVAQCLAAVLQGGGLAVAHFAACRAMRPLLTGWAALQHPSVPMIVALARCFRVVMPALPPTALDVLAGQDTLGLLYVALVGGREAMESKVVAGVMEVLACIVIHATDSADLTHGRGGVVRRGLVQARVREMRFLEEALAAMVLFREDKIVLVACLRFLRAAVEDNVQNIVELGTARETSGLELILGCAGDSKLSRAFASDPTTEWSEERNSDTSEILCAVCDLAAECSKVRKNFQTFLDLGLTVKLIHMVIKTTSSVYHVQKALELLHRCMKTSELEGKKAYEEYGPSSVVSCMQFYRHNPRVQEAGIRALTSMIEVFERNRDAACEVHAIQAVHFALTEHSKDSRVVAVSCQLLLQFAPFHLMSSNLQIQELKKLLRARFKTHREDSQTAMMIDDLATSLDLISQQSVRAIDDFFTGGAPDRSGLLAGGSLSSRRLRSSKGAVNSSFRLSFHRKGRPGQGRGSSGESHRRRRAKSDFESEATFQRMRNDTSDGSRSFRFRGSRLREKSWMDNCARWPSEMGEGQTSRRPKPEDEAAYDPLIETLTRYRETQQDALSYGSFQSTARRKASRERRSAELQLFSGSGNKPPLQTQREMRDIPPRHDIDWLPEKGERKEFQRELQLQTLVEKRVGPIVRTRSESDNVHIDGMGFDAVDSNSGRSELDVGEEDSIFSLSESEVGSGTDGAWEIEQGRVNVVPFREETDSDQREEEVDDYEVDSSSDIDFQTVSPQTKEVFVGKSESENENEGVDAELLFDVDDERFLELDEGTTEESSSNSQNAVSILTDSLSNSNTLSDNGSELVPQSQKYGERERVRSENGRNSGSWGPPKEMIWPLISIDNALDAHRASPVPRPHARGESGSLTSRRSPV